MLRVPPSTPRKAGFASFLIGAVDGAGINDDTPVHELYGRYHAFSPFAEDDIKLTSKLTVNLGLRWDIWSPYSEKENRFSFINLNVPNPITGTPGALLFGGNGPSGTYCNCTRPIGTWYKNLGPRVGFAYAINGKTAIRGAYGVSYTHAGGVGGRANASTGTGQLGFTGGISSATSNGGLTPAFYLNNAPGFTYMNSAVPSYVPPPNINSATGTGFTTTPGYTSLSPNGVNFPDPYLSRRAPEYQDFNFGVQREVIHHTTLSLDYGGSTGHFLGTSIGRTIYTNQLNSATYVLGGLLSQPANPANIAAAKAILPAFSIPFPNFSTSASMAQALRPFPQYNGFSDIWGDIGSSNYSSLQLALKQSDIRGFTYGLSYTFAKTFDDTGSSRSSYGYQGRSAAQEEYSLSTIDVPSHFTLYYIYNLPFGKGRGNHLLNALIQGWALSGIVTRSSGTPLVITATGCNNPDGGTCMPNVVPGYSGSPRINGGWGRKNTATQSYAYIDSAAFAIPAAYTLGNAPRTYAYALRNPGTYEEDLSVRRVFKIYERPKFTFEMSAYNLDNHVDFNGPATTVGSSILGTVTSQANSTRDAQASARLDF
ncbi:outer membrane beta-barrel protein [Bryocella elongata]